MKEARIRVDFNELIGENLVCLSNEDYVINSKGKKIVLKTGSIVKLYANDLSGCMEEDNLIADGVVELNNSYSGTKWLCRINAAGIYNESQKKRS